MQSECHKECVTRFNFIWIRRTLKTINCVQSECHKEWVTRFNFIWIHKTLKASIFEWKVRAKPPRYIKGKWGGKWSTHNKRLCRTRYITTRSGRQNLSARSKVEWEYIASDKSIDMFMKWSVDWNACFPRELLGLMSHSTCSHSLHSLPTDWSKTLKIPQTCSSAFLVFLTTAFRQVRRSLVCHSCGFCSGGHAC